jgi:hypothetical protein
MWLKKRQHGPSPDRFPVSLDLVVVNTDWLKTKELIRFFP